MKLSNTLKTWTLMALLGALFVGVGGLLAGRTGLLFALVFAVALNGFVYWKSDTLALKANRARPLAPNEHPRVQEIVGALAQRMAIPMPKLYLVERPEPNAFATGRNPSHSAVAVTTGLLSLMDDRQLAGVLAHEMSHIKNRDTLVGTIAATIGGAISALAQMAQFQMIFGGGNDDEGGNPLGLLAAIILAPIAALIIQLAVSRGREYLADRTGADVTGDPESLAQALEKLEAASRGTGLLGRLRGRRGEPQPQPAMNPAFAHLYIVNPLAGVSLGSLVLDPPTHRRAGVPPPADAPEPHLPPDRDVDRVSSGRPEPPTGRLTRAPGPGGQVPALAAARRGRFRRTRTCLGGVSRNPARPCTGIARAGVRPVLAT